MNSIKTFWSPELKKERALRKDEATKMAVWKEQYKVVQEETQVKKRLWFSAVCTVCVCSDVEFSAAAGGMLGLYKIFSGAVDHAQCYCFKLRLNYEKPWVYFLLNDLNHLSAVWLVVSMTFPVVSSDCSAAAELTGKTVKPVC